jgi:uncharacterized protein (TIRG00374 family)
MTALANTVNNLTPGSVGELLRLYLLRERHGVGYSIGAAVVLIERVVAIGYLAGSAAIAWLVHVAGWPSGIAVVGFVLLALVPAAMYRVGIRPSATVTALPLGRPVGRERWGRIRATLTRIDATIGGLLTHPVRIVVFAGTTTLILLTYTVQLMLVGRAAGVELDPLLAWGALGLSITVGVVSFLPFGLGATDLALATLLGAASAGPATALAIVVGYRLTTTVPLALVGSLSYGYVSATLPDGATVAMREASRALEASGPERVP